MTCGLTKERKNVIIKLRSQLLWNTMFNNTIIIMLSTVQFRCYSMLNYATYVKNDSQIRIHYNSLTSAMLNNRITINSNNIN